VHVSSCIKVFSLQEHANNGTVSPDPFNRKIAEFGRCPPPKLVSLAAFDDLVIKILGDRGGSDEELWNFAQQLPSRPVCENVGGGRIDNRATMGGQEGEATEINKSSDPSSQEIRPMASATGAVLPDELGSASNNVLDVAGTSHLPQRETLPAIVYKHWTGLSHSLNSAANWCGVAQKETISAGQASELSPQPDDAVAAMNAVASRLLSSQRGTLAQAHKDVNVALGKRGRYFLDIWDEEDFLQRYKNKTKFRSLRSWDDLFQPGYCDNHDGCYRDWLLGKQQDTKMRLMGSKGGRKKRQSDPIFWSAVIAPYDNTKLKGIVAPPVPVAIHHPAAWGVRPASAAGESWDVATVHPASIRSAEAVRPQHERFTERRIPSAQSAGDSSGSSVVQGRSGSPFVPYTDIRAARRLYGNQLAVAKLLEEGGAAAAAASAMESGVEDVDDFNLYAAQLQRQLQAEEARNFVRLSRLQQVLGMHRPLEQLATRRERLEQLVHKAVRRMEPCSVDRVVYAYKPAKFQAHVLARSTSRSSTTSSADGKAQEDVIRLDVQGNVISRAAADSATSSANAQSRYGWCHARLVTL
jgi:hypothetical protein